MKKVTKHGKKRLKQRNINKGKNGISLSAKAKGKTKFYYEGEFYDYLETKASEGKIVKVYKNDIYIYSRNSNNLITTYPVPNKFIPVEQFLMENRKRYVIENIKVFYNRDCKVTLKDNTIIKGIITSKLYNEKDYLIGIVITDQSKNDFEILIDDIESVDLNNEDFTRQIAEEMGLKI